MGWNGGESVYGGSRSPTTWYKHKITPIPEAPPMKMPRHVCYLVMTPYTPSACHLSPAPNGSRVGLQSRKWATPSSVPSLLSGPAGTAGVGGPLPSDLLVEQAGQNSGRSHSLACYVGTPALGVFTLSYTTALPLPSENPQPHPSQVNTPFPAFELWCWRRLLRDPWTARRSNQSILKEINPEYSQEALMLNLQLQNFGHLM